MDFFPARALRVAHGRLEREVEPWDQVDLAAIMHEENKSIGLPVTTFMTALRHALSGMKVRAF